MKRFDSERMFNLATSFFMAGERCAPDLEFGAYGIHSVSAPRIVLYSLAVEIALKLILQIHDAEIDRKHNLRELFDRVPAKSRERLARLDSCIDEISSYFVNWRYSYEHEQLFGEFDNSRRAFIECYREIRRLNPALVSVYEQNWGGFEPDWDYAWPELEIAQIEARLK